MDVYLEKIEPEANCFRFYTIRTEPDFFEEGALVVQWGRIGRKGQTRVRGSGTLRQCEEHGAKILRLRLKHGYEPRDGLGLSEDVLEGIRPSTISP